MCKVLIFLSFLLLSAQAFRTDTVADLLRGDPGSPVTAVTDLDFDDLVRSPNNTFTSICLVS
jgi:hypothetical protein